MKTEEEIKKAIEYIEKDERLHYPPANVFVNAPLAFIQQDLESRLFVLKWMLEDETL